MVDFTRTSEQEQLSSTLQSFLAARYGFAKRMEIVHSGTGRDDAMWQAFARELGILGVGISEGDGGVGGAAADIMVVMEAFGENLVIDPFLETLVVAAGLLNGAGDRQAELARIAGGDARFAFAWAEADGRSRFDSGATFATHGSGGWILDGHKAVVTGAPWATDLLVVARTHGSAGDADGLSLFLVDPATEHVQFTSYPTIDGRRAADIRFDKVHLPASALVGQEGHALPSLEKVADAAIAALAAEAVGIMRRMVADTIAYTKQRRQFGQPIAGFQALQHRMVDMYMQLELAKSASYLVTLSLNAAPADRKMAASAAKVTIGKALRFVGQNAIQLHGGMGMTDELAVGHYFKRATVIESEFGSSDYHLARYSELARMA